MNFEHLFLNEKHLVDQFFDICLQEALYQPSSERNASFSSYLKNTFIKKNNDKIMAVLLKDNEKTVGIAVLEYEPLKFRRKIITSNHRYKTGYKVEKDFGDDYTSLGFFSIYIKKEYRGHQYSFQMIEEMIQMIDKIENFFQPLIECKEKSFDLWKNKKIEPINMKRHQGNFKYALSDITMKNYLKKMSP